MTSAKSASPREVTVFGTDASGKPFFQSARVAGVDGFEATIEGLSCTVDVNNVVGLRCGGQKGRFRVMWVGRKDTPQQGQVGLRAVDRQTDFLSALERQRAVGARERRRYPRIRCQGEVRFRREGSQAPNSGALKMLSEGGCFIETAATAPELAHLEMELNVDGLALHSVGEVHGLQPGSGMGIAFVEMNRGHRIRLHEWVSQHCRSQAAEV